MVALFTADEILYSTHGRIAAGGIDDHKGRLVWDLEDIQTGDWFLALAYGAVDTHDYLSMAFEMGAHGCLVNRRSRYSFAPKGRTLISVAETSVALLELVSYWRHAVHPTTVGVAGSMGRRATIELIHHLLRNSIKCHVAFDGGGFGCASDVLSMPEGTELLLFEAGAVERGDVARMGSALAPNIAVITRTQHPLPSVKRDAQIAALYCEILETVNRFNCGSAVVYDENPAVRERCMQLLPGLVATMYSDRGDSVQTFSQAGVDSLCKQIELVTEQPVMPADLWCALEAARAIGLSYEQINAAIGKAVTASSR
ncbi:MAG: hypothetical protein K2X81_16655 [Candidatus Obscuribacterales bacterium]|nr:hypothetical protein [Candidatus Obscuribacterales bacterium]